MMSGQMAEERAKMMLDSAPLSICFITKDAKCIDCNQETLTMFGMESKQEFCDKFFDFSPEFQPCGRQSEGMRTEILNRAFREDIAPFEWLHQSLDGALIESEVTLIRSVYQDDDVILICIRDLRQLKQRELEANEANDRMRIMFDSMPFTANLINKNYEIIDCNQEAINMFGAQSKKDYSERFYEFMPEYQPNGKLSKEMAYEELARAFEEGQSHFEFFHKNAKGEIIPLDIVLTRVEFNNEDIVMGYSRDLRDVKSALSEVKKARDRIHLMEDSIYEMNKDATVLSNLDNMVTITDFDHNLIYINKSLADTFEVDIENYRGKKCYSYLRGKDQPCSFCYLEKLLPAKGTLPAVDYGLTYDEYLDTWMSGRAGIIRWIDGSLVYLHTTRDSSELKRSQEQLYEATKQAEAASEAKSTFLANMSHEIRTPMNAVLGMAELLRLESLNERQQRYVDDIKSSAESLLYLINDILDASKLQAGKLNLSFVHYSFNAFMDNIASVAQFLAEEKGITFRLKVPEKEQVCLYGDDVRLRQVMLNLVSNAIKFTERGFVQVDATFTDTTIRIAVSDTGIGIPAESLPMLFDAFEQADLEKNRHINGTGLGLTITRAIVELMGGEISVRSVYGQGSTFEFEIPKVLGDCDSIQALDGDALTISAPQAWVLVVDDNLVNLNVAEGLLELCEINVDTATSGTQAIEMIAKKPYDLVFMDHRMPGLSGTETTKALRESGVTLPIVALTASAAVGAREMMMQAGMNDYLSKPIIKKDLMQVLKKWIAEEKLVYRAPERTPDEDDIVVGNRRFWESIDKIEALCVPTGLSRVGNERDVYERSLRLMGKEIERSCRTLNELLSNIDMDSFRIEIHGLKGSLANVGAKELSAKAYDLEVHSVKNDVEYCVTSLPLFLEELNALGLALQEAFASMNTDYSAIKIPRELAQVFERMIHAFGEMDLILIEKELRNLDALRYDNALKEEIEQIKDMVLVMDYDGATSHIDELLEMT
ncbi:MAG: response regulator [Coriobacteriales bacterium]|nr:response regulator [Coriobacteriales bacterium]